MSPLSFRWRARFIFRRTICYRIGMQWDTAPQRQLVRLALREDAARQDITTRILLNPRLIVRAEIYSKQKGIVCGLPLCGLFFQALDPGCKFTPKVSEGAQVRPGSLLCVIEGKARAILSAERTALNVLQHLCGIATFTHSLVRILNSRKTFLYDTRKTLPGWRELQKYAVRCGGGRNHRTSLKDAILIKDNHIQVCRLDKTDWIQKIRKARHRLNSLPIQMEIQNRRDLEDALRLSPEFVLLDNLPPLQLRTMIRELRAKLPGVQIEVSGGIGPQHLTALRTLGVERISIGRLTHSAPAFDCHLQITYVFHPTR